MDSRFYFATCQAGAEKAVKAEVAAELPALRFAFSRPGFVTFKETDGAAPLRAPGRAVFVRLWGEALGQAKDRAALEELLSCIPAGAAVQCFDRDEHLPGEEPPGFARDAGIRSILGAWSIPLPSPVSPRVGETVYSLIRVDGSHVFLGRHVHRAGLSGLPGNIVDLPLPAEAPSRAYLKIEEAIFRFKPAFAEGMAVLEIGCAPGGATSALLARGLRVTGVDPQYMDGSVFSHPRFASIRKMAKHLEAEDLRGINPDWLVMDMSIAPLEALDELAHAVGLLRGNFGSGLRLRGGFLTVKLNDWSFASSIPLYLRRIEQIGFRELRPPQLCSNRQEFFVWAPRFAR
jgi:23S rRNA (cytidine2498-2'-O)-methyltransferase